MPHPYEIKFPALAKKYQNKHENIGFILSVIDNECKHFFNLNDLEAIVNTPAWERTNSYIELFEQCIVKSGSDYTDEEIKAKLLPYLHERVNNSNFGLTNFTAPKGCTEQIGLWEKFNAGVLKSDLTKNDVLKDYTFSTLDMARTAAGGSQKGGHPTVLELRHLAYLKVDALKEKPLYVRSSSGDQKGLSQWILVYYKEGIPHLYSESPISEDDKKALEMIHGPQKPIIEGGASALSMSSGIHALSHFIQHFGGAGLSSSADYFSLLVEWVWFTSGQHPTENPKWTWEYFKQRVLQWDQPTHKFSLLDFNKLIGNGRDNEHMQMRSYFLGLDWALADTPAKALTIDSKTSVVTLKVTPDLVGTGVIYDTYTQKGYSKKAAYSWNEMTLKAKNQSDMQSSATFASTLVLNVFRSCAREKALVIDLPAQYQLDADEQALVCYLMEMNPYVCDFQNRLKNASLTAINNNLQHIFARNRWLSINAYLPPLLDEFWVVAAEYWVAYLKTSPDLLAEVSEVKEFKRCIREMGIHGLLPLLQYLDQHAGVLKPAFNTLLQNIDRPPVFYGGCAASDVKQYTQALITHLQQKRYFPFRQFQFSFIPGVNKDIITLLTELNQQEVFDKISLVDCLVSAESRKALELFLQDAITQAKKDDHWICPIHIPELENPLIDPQLTKAVELYGELNNLLVKRSRQKQAGKLAELPAFAKAPQAELVDQPKLPLPGQPKQKTQANITTVNKFNQDVARVWHADKQPISLSRAGGLTLQMQQQQQIKQERSRCLDNEMEKGTAYADVLPSLLIDYNNIDQELGSYYQNLNQESPIDESKAILSGNTVLQQFFHTWVNANPTVSAPHTIQKMTPHAAKMLLKFHRQLSGGLNVDNLPVGFYTQRNASGELVLGYKSTLSYSTDHNPFTMQLNNSIPKVERVLGDYKQFDHIKTGSPFDLLRLLAQMQPELSAAEKEKRYNQFSKTEFTSLAQDKKGFFTKNADWIKSNWELFYAAYRSNSLDDLIKLKASNKPVRLSTKEVTSLLLQQAPEVKMIFDNHEELDYAKGLGQIYSFYGNYGIQRFSNLILTMHRRLGHDFVDHFIKNYLKHCETFSPLLQEKSLATFEQMIAELSADPYEAMLFGTFLELQMAATGLEEIHLLWKGFSYFYNHIKEMGLEQGFTPERLKALKPRGQNLFPCFDRIFKSLEKIPNQDLRKEFIARVDQLDLTEGGVPYAVRHDGFVLVDPSLELEDFKQGTPTYKAPMQQLFSQAWIEPLYTLRALGSKFHIKPEHYKNFKEAGLSREQLIWALHTSWKDTAEFYNFIKNKAPQFVHMVAHHFHHVFYQQGHTEVYYSLSMFESLSQHHALVQQVLNKYPNSNVLFDCCRLVHEMPQYEENLARIFNMILSQNTPTQHPHLEQGLILATAFGVQEAQLSEFYKVTRSLKQITRNDLTILTTQLKSLNISSLPADPAVRQAIWAKLLGGIARMDKEPLAIAEIRKELMQRLKNDHGLVFKTSISGDYRLVTDEDIQPLGVEGFFEQHADRLKNILKKHIAIAESEKNKDPLKPLIEFFKRLQLNKTYINELEPLLITLEKILKNHPNQCWTASYLSEMLRALMPEDNTAGFSISIFETLLTETPSPFQPMQLDEVQPHFDVENKWRGILNAILSKAQTFSRNQQAQVARLAIRSQQEPDFIQLLLTQLSHQDFDGLRESVLSRLLAEKEPEQYSTLLAQCANLVQLNPENIPPAVWKATSHLWIDTLVSHPEFVDSFKNIMLFDSPKKEQILSIIAYSSFPSHRYTTVPRSDYFKGGARAKIIKLEKQLATLSKEELSLLAACYPGKPAPDTRDLLSMIKHKKEMPVDKALHSFLTEEQSILRQDYQQLSSHREFDLERMLKLTYVTRGDKNEPISPKMGIRLMLMFQYLKQLEQGELTLGKETKSLSQMTREELQKAFVTYTRIPNDDLIKTTVWAILFEVLGRTTGKYPHLAQQFALIANEVLLVDDPSKILQLKTGEGKSHFVALRAARFAGLGKKVIEHTVKWSLAERDLLDYQEFFDWLKIPAANVHARSSRDTYTKAQIVYTTPGDFSLFLDEQASQGSYIEVNKQTDVALGDEFDFLYYEGQKTQFNYARHTGITPKDMAWFYQRLNQFYDTIPGDRASISPQIIKDCFKFLANHAPEDGLIYLESLTPMALLGWLQSAHEAASLRSGVDYTARLEQIKIGEEEFQLREIYPLTKDMQAAVGASFSHGVHQLLAARLNAEAQKRGEAQDYHVHPESDIVSSQVFSQRLKSRFGRWEGFTGTVSSSQALELYAEHKTAVLRVPTNQKDLRKWPQPEFFDNDIIRLQRMVSDIKKRIAQKKSILLCCSTDAEVKSMTEALRKSFTQDEFERHFLSYTNESHDSPAAILRRKTQMEGSYLGQKEQGVVLIAAGFGRGDNVGVETVMLGSVHDENDLGQKGGRTARNGAEGEVLQYYITKDIDSELNSLRNVLRTNNALYDQVMRELLKDDKHPMAVMEGFLNPRKNTELRQINPAIKFNFVLRVREFLAAQDNYPSLVYHEAKAVVSSEGIRMIGMASVEKKESLIKGFADFLGDLEKEWTKIQSLIPEVDARKDALYDFLNNQLKPTGRLSYLFREVGKLDCVFNAPQKSQFMLDREMPEPGATEQLMAQAQRLLLKLDKVSDSTREWNELTEGLSSLNSTQLTALIALYRDRTVIPFDVFLEQLRAMRSGLHAVVKDLDSLKDKKLKISKLTLNPTVQHALIAMPADASNLAHAFLMMPGAENPEERVARAIPLIEFSIGNKSSMSYWENPITRDALMSLPEGCLAIKPMIPLDASVLLGLKQFLDRFTGTLTKEAYASTFKEFVRGMTHHPEQRSRLLSHYEVIVAKSKNPVLVLDQLAKLNSTLSAPEHLTMLKSLVEKMAAEYKKPRVSIEELDKIWMDLSKAGSQLLNFLPLIEAHLNTEGKEYVSLIHTISTLDPELITASQELLKVIFARSPVKSSKRERIKDYEQTVSKLKETFSGQTPVFLNRVFQLFSRFVTSTEFLKFNDKKSLLEGMRALGASGITEKELFPKYRELPQLLSLVYLCKHFPSHASSLPALEVIVKHFSPVAELNDDKIGGINALLKAIPSKITLDELVNKLQVFNNKEKIADLLYLCHRFPGHAVDLLSFESVVSSLHSEHYLNHLREGQRQSYLEGIRVLLDKKLIEKNKDIPVRLSKLNNHQKDKLFLLFKTFEAHVGETSDTDFLPWVNFLCSREYDNLSSEEQEITFPSIQTLLRKGKGIFAAGKGIAQFSKAQDMAELLQLTARYPEYADKLLALKPLISLITQIPDVNQKEAARTAVGHFLENQHQFKTPFASIQDRVASLNRAELIRLLGLWHAIPNHAVSIMKNNLPRITAHELTPDQQFVIEELYKQENKNTWVRDNLMALDSRKRVALMTFLRNGDFIIQPPDPHGPKFTETLNKQLFETGLECYKHHINTILQAKPDSSHRGLSAKQQGQIKDIMAEFRRIGKSPVAIAGGNVKANLVEAIRGQVAAYEGLWIKNSERHEMFKWYMSDLSKNIELSSYRQTLTLITQIKRELMRHDVNVASQQWIPRLHFWGQSRMYRQLNNIEDLVMKAWMEESRQQRVSADEFSDSYQKTRNDYIEQFKESLATWVRDQRSIFKSSTALEMHTKFQWMSNDDIVKFLKDNPRALTFLPGTLKAIANEVLTHDTYVPGKKGFGG